MFDAITKQTKQLEKTLEKEGLGEPSDEQHTNTTPKATPKGKAKAQAKAQAKATPKTKGNPTSSKAKALIAAILDPVQCNAKAPSAKRLGAPSVPIQS